MHEEMTPAQIHAQEALVRALGVVPRDFNLEKFVVSLLTEQAAGFYDPKRKTMYIADWVPPEMQSMTLSHELTHALQDQNWDLDSYLHGARDDDDASAARQAVVEGYATAAMVQQSTGGVDLGELQSLTPLLDALTSSAARRFRRTFECALFFPRAAPLSLCTRHGLYRGRLAAWRLERPQRAF